MSVVSVSKDTKSYKDLLVWQKAVDLAVDIYNITENFPRNQQYGLTNQIERSVVSVASNLAEGAGRNRKNEFIYHVKWVFCRRKNLMNQSQKLRRSEGC